MCSIAGLISAQRNDKVNPSRSLEVMLGSLYHRGPDDSGVWWREAVDGPTVGLASTRLAILDLSPAGHMPMQDADGCVLTYNGETYNYLDLRRELDESESAWQSHTDTEVVLRAYQRWGADAWRRLRGMFALALWDETQQTLHLVRDPFGIKPVYYYHDGAVFVFASEVRALLASGLVPRRLSRAGAASFLHYGAVDEPDTIIAGVRAVRPGHCLTVREQAGRLEIRETPYAQNLLPAVSPFTNRREAVGVLRETLRESVRLHLASDVPLGVFLSGGIDSSAIVALMSEVTTEKPRTFSVVFAEEQFSEKTQARLVADKFGTEHTEIPLSEDRLIELLPDALAAMDQPTQDFVNTYVVAQAVKAAGITVALSGLGSDELFAGYPTFRRALQMRTAARVPRVLRRAAASVGGALSNASITRRKTWRLLASDGQAETAIDIARQLFLREDVEALTGGWPDTASPKLWPPAGANGRINAASLHELQNYMANTLLRDSDGASMAHSLELRVPFVDTVVASLVVPLPGEWKVNGGRPKPLLLDALGGLLPDEIVYRKKMGFVLPFANWLQSRLRGKVDNVFADEATLKAIGLRPSAVQEVWQRFLKTPAAVGYTRPWALFVLARWCALHEVTLG